MDQIIRSRIDKSKTREENIHLVREFLQLVILRILHEQNHFQFMAFVGGTSLRFLYRLQRFSEDLDFSLIKKEGYNFQEIIKSIEFHLQKFGFRIDTKVKDEKIVQSAYLKFVDLLQRHQLARMKDEKLSIRIEIDTNPPAGWKTEMSIINDFYIFPVWHFDLSSLFATKIHACFFRKFKKGRDFYDLVWYLSKKLKPNFELLNNAIKQTENVELTIDNDNFQNFLKERAEKLDFEYLRADVEPFLVNKSEADLIIMDVLLKLIEKL